MTVCPCRKSKGHSSDRFPRCHSRPATGLSMEPKKDFLQSSSRNTCVCCDRRAEKQKGNAAHVVPNRLAPERILLITSTKLRF